MSINVDKLSLYNVLDNRNISSLRNKWDAFNPSDKEAIIAIRKNRDNKIIMCFVIRNCGAIDATVFGPTEGFPEEGYFKEDPQLKNCRMFYNPLTGFSHMHTFFFLLCIKFLNIRLEYSTDVVDLCKAIVNTNVDSWSREV